ncbi:MAG: mechanosensitive ion channel [archaeon]|nr:mechanosensitive ion channel [archaeon]
MSLNLGMFNITESFSEEMIIIVLIIVLTPLAAKFVGHVFFHLEKNSKRRRKKDITKQRMARNVVNALIYLIGFALLLYSIPELRTISIGLFAGVGFLGIVVGLAAQDTLANIVAGISLAIFQPFRLDDRLRIAGEYGTVEDITLRHTVIRTWENKRIISPTTSSARILS